MKKINKTDGKYKVLYASCWYSPNEAEKWLNKLYEEHGLELIATAGYYYYFKYKE